nr:MAG: hypothetical protein [Bacteriophage sp.]
MTLLALDGRFAGQVLAYVPKGYHCVMHLDNHHDIISCHPEYMRDQFICGMLDGLEAFTDPHTALRMVNAMRHGNLQILATQVLRFMVDTNLSIHLAQSGARKNERT